MLTTLTAFTTLMSPYGPSETAVRDCYAELVAHYTAAERFYHNLNHIEQTLTIAAELQSLAADYPAVQLALWFHDAIYDSRAADNEVQSAALAHRWLANLGVPRAVSQRVQQQIMATKSHTPTTIDEQIVVDADLAILGAEAAVYTAYSQAIRQEYAWVEPEPYRQGRSQVLRLFLQRPRIYHTTLLYEQLETAARYNMEKELIALNQKSIPPDFL